MSGVTSHSARLGHMDWAFHSFSASTAPQQPQAPAKAQPQSAALAADVIDLNVPRRGVSGQAIKNQVLRIDTEVSGLSKMLQRNQQALNDVQTKRNELRQALSQKLLVAQQLKDEQGGAEADKAQNQADIDLLSKQIKALDTTIGSLQDEQAQLAQRAVALAAQHRKAYDEANGAKNYAQYLKTLPKEAQADDSLKQAMGEAGSDQAKKAAGQLRQAESDIKATKVEQAQNASVQAVLGADRDDLSARREGARGQLDQTNQFIDALKTRQGEVAGGIDQDRSDLGRTDALIQKTETRIAGLEGKISDMESLRAEVLNQAISDRTADGEALAAKIDQLKAAITTLRGELRQNQAVLDDLKQLKESAQ